MESCVLELAHVTKSFRDTVAVDDLSLRVRSGAVFGLLGPNGSGKTTTLRMILGILLPDSGAIHLWGHAPSLSARERVGYLPEERGLYEKMRVAEHLVFFGELHGMSRSKARDETERLLAEHKSTEWANRKVETLSKGQQQTVQLMGTMLHDPDLLILDEPFNGLDPVNVARLQTTIRSLRDAGKTILLSTHRMDQVERVCDEICLISRGKSLLCGSLRDVKAGFGRNVVDLVAEGADRFEPDDLIAEIEPRSEGVHLRLHPGADTQELLRRALAAGRVERFNVAEPSLEEIFVDAVNSQ